MLCHDSKRPVHRSVRKEVIEACAVGVSRQSIMMTNQDYQGCRDCINKNMRKCP